VGGRFFVGGILASNDLDPVVQYPAPDPASFSLRVLQYVHKFANNLDRYTTVYAEPMSRLRSESRLDLNLT
jgi:hypothetical protein